MPLMRALALAVCACAATAQEMPVAPEAFLDMAEGQTVTFILAQTGMLVGEERFIDRQRSVWMRNDGSCALGDITIRGAKVCFVYDDDPGTNHCWLPFEVAGQTYVRSTINGEVQMVTRVEKRRIECLGEPIS